VSCRLPLALSAVSSRTPRIARIAIPEAYLTSAILRSCKHVERDNELMSPMLVWQLHARWLNRRLKITIVLQAWGGEI
jgi:hypothetical protein